MIVLKERDASLRLPTTPVSLNQFLGGCVERMKELSWLSSWLLH